MSAWFCCALLAPAAGLIPVPLPASVAAARTPSAIRAAFEMEAGTVAERKTRTIEPNAYRLSPSVTHSRVAPQRPGGAIAVTDGSGTFYDSRALIQSLHDFGRSVVPASRRLSANAPSGGRGGHGRRACAR